MGIERSAKVTSFGTLPDGDAVLAVHLSAGDTTATILTHGARLTDLRRRGITHPLVLGSPTLPAYVGPMQYFGAVVGPVANRIAGGQFSLDDVDYHLDRNEAGRTTLHGGAQGFSARNWHLAAADRHSCTLILQQRDGLCGFPGALSVRVRYALGESGDLDIEISGQTARTCLFAPAFHAYWNLDGSADLSRHRLTIHAAEYLPVDDTGIPTSGPQPTAGTAFDYREARPPGADLDHCFCLAPTQTALREVCLLEADTLAMTLETTEPGLQVYTAGRLDTAPYPGLGGQPYGPFAGIALEPQMWPDAANRPEFPSPRLDPGQFYRQLTRFRFQNR